jgi:hypothetical protein
VHGPATPNAAHSPNSGLDHNGNGPLKEDTDEGESSNDGTCVCVCVCVCALHCITDSCPGLVLECMVGGCVGGWV